MARIITHREFVANGMDPNLHEGRAGRFVRRRMSTLDRMLGGFGENPEKTVLIEVLLGIYTEMEEDLAWKVVTVWKNRTQNTVAKRTIELLRELRAVHVQGMTVKELMEASGMTRRVVKHYWMCVHRSVKSEAWREKHREILKRRKIHLLANNENFRRACEEQRGVRRSESVKRRMSEAQIGKKRRPMSEETRAGLIGRGKGLKRSEETRRRISQGMKDANRRRRLDALGASEGG